MASPSSPSPQTNLGIAPNIGGLLCYAPCIGLVFSIVAAIVEKTSRFVRFHAFQSLLLHGAMIVLWIFFFILMIVLGMVFAPLAALVWLLQMLVGLGLFALTILMMVKAYNNEEFALPVIGEMAKKWL